MSNRFDILIFEDAQEMQERRKKESKNRKKNLAKIEKLGYCEGFQAPCECKDELSWINALTHYYWDMDKYPLENPNRDIFLCRNCGEAYISHWEDMWREYYAARM